ncbi:hypothetical protein MVEN_00343800 [Mycena venus]|uniref:C2H2-type domain-containing protein n=1 Tax=Mycena venus TaxID=2733690 RepID=A0A8H6YP85_9AGAR|nr:hypothetical protein MVEN_00343800 [Mycena venus]
MSEATSELEILQLLSGGSWSQYSKPASHHIQHETNPSQSKGHTFTTSGFSELAGWNGPPVQAGTTSEGSSPPTFGSPPSSNSLSRESYMTIAPCYDSSTLPSQDPQHSIPGDDITAISQSFLSSEYCVNEESFELFNPYDFLPVAQVDPPLMPTLNMMDGLLEDAGRQQQNVFDRPSMASVGEILEPEESQNATLSSQHLYGLVPTAAPHASTSYETDVQIQFRASSSSDPIFNKREWDHFSVPIPSLHNSSALVTSSDTSRRRKPVSRECAICHDTFSRPCALRKHMKIHEETQPTAVLEHDSHDSSKTARAPSNKPPKNFRIVPNPPYPPGSQPRKTRKKEVPDKDGFLQPFTGPGSPTNKELKAIIWASEPVGVGAENPQYGVPPPYISFPSTNRPL